MSYDGAPVTPPVVPPLAGVEHVRRGAVPLIGLLASGLGLTCMLNLADLPQQVAGLTAANDRFAGWAGVGALAGICVVLLSLLAAPRIGAGPPIAIGAAAAVFGLALGRAVYGDAQLAVALVVLGLAAGGLLGGAVCLTLERLSSSARRLTVAAWAVPMVAVFPVLDDAVLRHSSGDSIRLSLHPPIEPLAVVSVLLVGWSALSMLVEPVHDSPLDQASSTRQLIRPASSGAPIKPAEAPWAVIGLAALLPTLAVMLMGFDPEISVDWLRPLIILAAAGTFLGLATACRSLPTPAARLGAVATGVVTLCWPVCSALLLRVADGTGDPVPVLAIAAVVAAGVAGALVGTWRPAAGVGGGLLLLAAGAAGGWIGPSSPWLMVASAAPMAAGSGAALLGGLGIALDSPLDLRLVGATSVSTLILGALLSLPLIWALGGALPISVAQARSGSRLFLGLTFALAVLAAGYTATLARRLGHPAAGGYRSRR